LTDLAAPEEEAAPPVVDIGEVEGLSEKPESFGRQAWDRFRKHKVAIAGAVLLSAIILLFIFAPMVTPYAPDEPNVLERNQGPSLDHPFGTDDLGRDLMARVFTGGRVSLLIAFIVSIVATTLGTLLGAIAGYIGGFTDTAVSQVINLFLAVPLLPVLLVFSVRFGSNPISVALLLSFFLWIRAARVVRGQFLSLKSMEFVQAARAMGAKPMRIIGRHILPNTLGPILVEATLLAGLAIILESTLSFLGLGVKAPDTSLGVLVDEAKGFITDRPTRILIPGSMITLIVLSINFLGDGLRDALDPTSRVGD
jgi:ABC-type dipeptide/oligopeptide/nickel transport system permease subunit